jgi:hypothetical protein
MPIYKSLMLLQLIRKIDASSVATLHSEAAEVMKD